MLLDAQNVFSNDQAITVDTASTDQIDLAVAGRAAGNDLAVIAQVTEAFNNLTTLEFQVQSCAVENFGSGVVTHQRVTMTLAQLIAGRRVDLGRLLQGTLRYVRVFYDVTGTAPTTGKVTAMLIPFGDQTLVGQA